ncbi:uncharacterized protein GGS22DRAFT_192446 [Annulohypoxylon maeteangense]|uniref:uncharacterized protein n=1 Tax=Annulohypoxylon maeteangense TaxID=1927788 RepID=UPI002008B98C|nr:uncharacterized protein GGS22DRAFT_192446 [Annulohypoxylon maeteangense]KAI0881356.1 hypothetical protein GGS22DRAFT_192446 [Annulohypoxylon maeteangense]
MASTRLDREGGGSVGGESTIHTTHNESSSIDAGTGEVESPYYEPWILTKMKVQRLFGGPWPHGPLVEFLGQGSHNRVFGVTYIAKNPGMFNSAPRCCVIRIPKSKEVAQNSVAVLNYLKKTTSFPVPRVIVYNPTTNNAIGYPYVVTTRIQGISLSEAIKRGINHEQMLCIAKELGCFYKGMISIKSKHAGLILSSEDGPLSDTFARILPLGAHEGEPIKEYDSSYGKTSSGPFVVHDPPNLRCAEIMHRSILSCRWRDSDEDQGYERSFWKKIAAIYGEMDTGGLFSGNDICLTHATLCASNIMVDNINSTISTVTGIVGWNKTLFLPRFLAAEPPMFLWNPVSPTRWMSSYDKLEAELQTFGGLTVAPATPQRAELKQAFEKYAGESYTSLPFTKEGFLAGRMLQATFLEADDFLLFTVTLQKYIDVWYGKGVPSTQTTKGDDTADEATEGKPMGNKKTMEDIQQRDGLTLKTNEATDNVAYGESTSNPTNQPMSQPTNQPTSTPKKIRIKVKQGEDTTEDGQGDG